MTALVAASVSAAACAAKPEQATLDEFFRESKLFDKTALAHLATVVFDPSIDGSVETFRIADVSPVEHNTKTVTVVAQVEVPGSRALVQKTILLTLAKDALPDDPAARGRWIVTGFIERAGSPTPRS